MDCIKPGFPVLTISWSLLKLLSIELVIPSNHLILCYPLLLPPSIFPSIGISSSASAFQIRWPKDWSFSFSISASSEYSGLISFKIDWFDLLAVQGTLKRLLQHHSLKASSFQLSAFFIVQHSHPYLTNGKTRALTRQNFVGKVICLLFNMLSRFVNFPGGSDGKASAYNAGDPGSSPGSGRSSGEGNGNPLQYSCLENPMDRGSWRATVHRVTKSRTRLSDLLHFTSRLGLS